jgi:hypothetical protein
MKNKHLIWVINRKKDRLRLNDDIKHKRVILHQTKNSKIFIAEYVES